MPLSYLDENRQLTVPAGGSGAGATGCQGATGVSGSPGAPGADGATGSPGNQGATGPTGVGTQGATDAQGATGVSGSPTETMVEATGALGTLNATDAGKTYRSTASSTCTLPACSLMTAGQWFHFIIGSANAFTVTLGTANTARYLGNVTSAAGTFSSSTQGSKLTVLYPIAGGSEWQVVDLDGTWSWT